MPDGLGTGAVGGRLFRRRELGSWDESRTPYRIRTASSWRHDLTSAIFSRNVSTTIRVGVDGSLVTCALRGSFIVGGKVGGRRSSRVTSVGGSRLGGEGGQRGRR